MNQYQIKASKLTIIKMDIVMNDIHRIWKSIDSPYVSGRNKLSEARSILYSNPKRAYKLMCKARSDMVEESKAAQVYNRYKKVIPQLHDKEVSDLVKKYEGALSKGDYKGARKIALKLSDCKSVCSAKQSLSLKFESQTSEALLYSVENSSNHDVTVKRFTVFIGTEKMDSDVVYPFTIHNNSRITVKFSLKAGVRGNAKADIEYFDEDIVKTVSVESCLIFEA